MQNPAKSAIFFWAVTYYNSHSSFWEVTGKLCLQFVTNYIKMGPLKSNKIPSSYSKRNGEQSFIEGNGPKIYKTD